MKSFLCLLSLLMPLHAMEIVHGDAEMMPVQVCTEQALVISSEEAAAQGWMQMYVFHPAPAERAELLRAGQATGAMAVLPAGSVLRLLAVARNRGAFMAEIISVSKGDDTRPAAGRQSDRQVPAADASYPFAIPPSPETVLHLRPGERVCFDSAEALSAIPSLHLP